MQKIFTDGSIAGNKASVGIYGIEGSKENIIFSDYVNAKDSTEAELLAILIAIKQCVNVKGKIQFFCDSANIVTLINNKNLKEKSNPTINHIIHEIQSLLTSNMRLFYIKRKNNRMAHKLAYAASTKGVLFNNNITENINNYHHYYSCNFKQSNVQKNKKIQKKINLLTNTLVTLIAISSKLQNKIIETSQQISQLQEIINEQ